MLKEHQAKHVIRKEVQERKKREAGQAATLLAHALVDHLNTGVAEAESIRRSWILKLRFFMQTWHTLQSRQHCGSSWLKTSTKHSRKLAMRRTGRAALRQTCGLFPVL